MLRVLTLACCLSWSCAHADTGSGTPFMFVVAPGITAHVRVLPDSLLEVQLQPSRRRQKFVTADVEEGNLRLSADDVDFDGRPELLVTSDPDSIYEHTEVYRYDPARAAFRLLSPGNGLKGTCPPFSQLSVDERNRVLGSQCRGRMLWHTDSYRYQGRHLYLYRSERTLDVASDDKHLGMILDIDDQPQPLAVWSTYDPTGRVLERAIGDPLVPPRNGAPLPARMATVVSERLPLYGRAGDARTKRYLVRDDRIELLDEADGWWKVRYDNSKRGDVFGWVNTKP